MATLKNRLELEDGMSPVLSRVRSTLDSVAQGYVSTALSAEKSFAGMRNAAQANASLLSQAANAASSAAGSAVAGIERQADSVAASISSLEQDFGRIGIAGEPLFNALSKISKTAGSLKASMSSAVEPMSSLFGRMGDSAVSALERMGVSTEPLLGALSKVRSSVGDAVASFGRTSTAVSALSSLNSKLNGVRGTLGHVALGCVNIAISANKAFNNMRSTIQRNVSSIATGFSSMSETASSALDRVGNHADSLSNKLKSMSQSLQQTKAVASTLSAVTGGLKNIIGGTVGKFALAGVAANAITTIASKVSELPGKLMSTAESYGGIQARLKLLVGSQSKVVEMNDAIYESALRSRGSFDSMADAVTKIGMTAKEAFPDPKEIIPFMEGIQKLFVIGGTSKENQGFAMLQLTQALGSGKLQGDEFRSIAENAPLIEQMVAKTLGVTQGELKQISSDGAITAEVVKKAILDNLDEINEQFAQMPMTFSQHMQRLETVAYKAFTPVMDIINNIWKSKEVTAIANIMAKALERLGNEAEYVLKGIINNAKWLANQVQEKWEIIKPILVAAGIAILGIGAKTLAAGALSALGWAISEGAMLAHAAASAIETVALIGLTLAQDGLTAAMAAFNGVLLANPMAWFVGLVFVLVGAFYVAIAVINKFAGTSISATGLIFGAFAWLITGIVNLVKFVANTFIGFVNLLGRIFQDPLSYIYNLFADIWNGVVELVGEAVNKIIELVNKIPGMDKVGKFSPVSVSGLTLEHKVIAESAPVIDTHFEYGNAGYNARATYDWVKNFSIADWFKSFMPDWNGDTNGGGGGNTDTDNSGGGDDGGVGKNTGRTADNTGRMADALDMLEDEVKDLREFANQEMINYYTHKEYSVTVGDINNSISRPADIDGVIDKVTLYLREGMNSGAEAVHI